MFFLKKLTPLDVCMSATLAYFMYLCVLLFADIWKKVEEKFLQGLFVNEKVDGFLLLKLGRACFIGE